MAFYTKWSCTPDPSDSPTVYLFDTVVGDLYRRLRGDPTWDLIASSVGFPYTWVDETVPPSYGPGATVDYYDSADPTNLNGIVVCDCAGEASILHTDDSIFTGGVGNWSSAAFFDTCSLSSIVPSGGQPAPVAGSHLLEIVPSGSYAAAILNWAPIYAQVPFFGVPDAGPHVRVSASTWLYLDSGATDSAVTATFWVGNINSIPFTPYGTTTVTLNRGAWTQLSAAGYTHDSSIDNGAEIEMSVTLAHIGVGDLPVADVVYMSDVFLSDGVCNGVWRPPSTRPIPLRQRQRSDGLTVSPQRQRAGANMPTSITSSPRQIGPNGYA